MGYVYRHVRLDKNEVFYVGLSLLDDPQYKRAYSRGDRRNQHWKNIINTTPYRVDIIMDDLTVEETYEKEKEFIKLYGRKDLGLGTLVNFTDGGEGSLGHVRSEEGKEKIRERMMGENNPMFGGNFSEEHRRKLSEAQTGKVRHSEEYKRNMSERQMGELNHNYGKRGELSPNFGRKATKELKERFSKMRKGKRMGIDNPKSRLVLDMYTGIFYYSASEAHRELSLKKIVQTFTAMLNGKCRNKTTCKYV